MEQFIASAKALSEELEQLYHNEADILKRAHEAGTLIRRTLTQFREWIRKDGFRSEANEVQFFKFIKPHIYSHLIFFTVLAEIEEQKLHLTPVDTKEYILKKERMFRHIMREHLEFVKYYRSGMTHKDKKYFIRNANPNAFGKHNNLQHLDPEFNTSHDFIAANIMAFDLFQRHFNPPKPQQEKKTSGLKWTSSKLDLVELIYALQASGAINYGEADLKDICALFETGLQIKVGDLYRAFHDISNRKKEQIKFVNKLKAHLERKISELEGMV